MTATVTTRRTPPPEPGRRPGDSSAFDLALMIVPVAAVTVAWAIVWWWQ
jgi:hypothetical protein